MYVRMCMYVRTYVHTYTYVRTYIHIRTYIHTYIHTYNYTYIYDAISVVSVTNSNSLVHKMTIVKRFDFHHTKAIAHCQSAIFDEFLKSMKRLKILILCTRLFVYIII